MRCGHTNRAPKLACADQPHGNAGEDGQWHHLASRQTSGWVEVFVDGVSFDSYFAPDNVNVDSSLIIGRHGTKELCLVMYGARKRIAR